MRWARGGGTGGGGGGGSSSMLPPVLLLLLLMPQLLRLRLRLRLRLLLVLLLQLLARRRRRSSSWLQAHRQWHLIYSTSPTATTATTAATRTATPPTVLLTRPPALSLSGACRGITAPRRSSDFNLKYSFRRSGPCSPAALTSFLWQ